ncbi:MAG: DUF4363 family protein [Oscillospiraceae bacterium]|nr:DUF4363 family protein [Oscillospiraceae bacterium]
MKKAAAAGALLALLLGLSVWNTHYMDAVIRDMTERIELCRGRGREGDFPSAEEELSAAEALWARMGAYAHIFLRQTETDTVENAIRDVRECLRAGDADGAEVALQWLEGRLAAMAAMEHISWESVF